MLLPPHPKSSPADSDHLVPADELKFYIDGTRRHVSVLVWLPTFGVIILRSHPHRLDFTAFVSHSCCNNFLGLSGLWRSEFLGVTEPKSGVNRIRGGNPQLLSSQLPDLSVPWF